jgi:hypothetical protein
MSEIPKPFEVTIGGRDLSLEAGKCACVLFRRQQEVDYLAVDISTEEEPDVTLRVFNNVPFVRWLAGIALEADGTPYMVTADEKLFRDEYGWNPAVIIKEQPNEDELEYFLDVNTRDLDAEWENQ